MVCFTVFFLLTLLGKFAFSVDLQVIVEEQGTDFKVVVDGERWFRSGPLAIRDAGHVWSSSNKEQYMLQPEKIVPDETGQDSLGSYVKQTFTWSAYINSSTRTKVSLETAVIKYSNIPAIAFDIVYMTGLTEASDPDNGDGTLSTFPAFVIEEDPSILRGWMTWSGNMARTMKFGVWSKDKIYGAMDGGFPLLVYDSEMKTALVMSPLTTFFSASQTTFTDPNTNETSITFGPLSSIDTVSELYRYRTVMVAGGNVTDAMKNYGEILRTLYKKDNQYRRTDFSLNYLGYWTDNGACYYYYTGKNYSNYEDLLVAVKSDADQKNIPFRYVQLDSWWYYKGEGGGVKNWTARPDIFPNGIESMVAKTGWPIVAHNRYWSADTDYAKQFKFIIEEGGAVPVDPAFWDYLISNAVQDWNLIVYEQDWLDVEMKSVKALQDDLDLGEAWLRDMGMSAQRYGITIQYCMPWPRHLLQSVMIPSVTQSRVSGDYGPSNEQWIIGDTTILAHAVGVAAYKDTFRSSSSQSDCASKYHNNESYPVLETYVAALTSGPVGPSDMIGTADRTLLMATCMTDGRLLKPTHPAMSLDSTFLRRAFGNKGPIGQMTAAFTEVSGQSWYYVMAAELKEDYAFHVSELPPTRNTFPSSYIQAIAFQYDIRTGKPFALEDVTVNSYLTVGKCEKEDFKYMVIAPVFENGMAIFGELNKFVPISETRFIDFDVSSDGILARMTGVPSEVVTVTVYNSKMPTTVDCIIGSDGYATLLVKLNSSNCS